MHIVHANLFVTTTGIIIYNGMPLPLTLNPVGYWVGSVNGKRSFAHHLVWDSVSRNYRPENMVVHHIDGNRKNFRYGNLKLVSTTYNARSRTKLLRNTSGTTGVYFSNTKRKWVAFIRDNDHRVIQRIFDSKEEAIECRENWQDEFGEGYGTMN
jgi:hypothetical protein